MSTRRVVVTGIGTISPLGLSAATSWEAACKGVSGISRISRFDPTAFSSQIAGEVKGFDPTTYVEQKEVKKLDLFTQYAIGAADEAWKESNLGATALPRERIGCILGVGIGGLPVLEKFHEVLLKDGPRRISPFLIPAMIPNLAPGNVAIRLGLKGVNFAITSACTSSTHAIGESYRMIALGTHDAMVSGGAEAAITPLGIGGFCALKALSTRNDAPEKASRPFDKDRDGFVMGEGAAVLVLEEYEHAKARGARMYAEVTGYGVSCDAFHITSPTEDGAGAYECMRLALGSAKLAPNQIQYINAHGTSTEANDRTESAAICRLFGDWAHKGLLVSSTKSMTGHLLGAAGAIEAIFSVLAIRDGIVPPTINLDQPSEGLTLNYVPHTAKKAALTNVLSNSFGFGGTNASVVFSRVL